MSVPQSAPQHREEAVLITGPRKGEIITLFDSEPQLSAAEEALLDQITASADRAAEHARGLSRELSETLEELRHLRLSR